MEILGDDIITQPNISDSLQGVSEKRATKAGAYTVLVVDDDPLVLELLQEYLKDGDYNVITAGSGEEAISKISSARIDIALIDFKMPGMDGLETIEKMFQSDPETVTILMTGFPTIDSSIQAIRLGASNYILKPFKLDEVNVALTRAGMEYQLRQEMRNLKKRVVELEKGIIEKKDNIKINQKLNIISTPEGYAPRIVHHELEPQRSEPTLQEQEPEVSDDADSEKS